MMVQNWAESTWEITNYGRFINQFPPNIIRSIQQFERVNKKICRQKMSIMFNQICINEEMLPIYIYIYRFSRSLSLSFSRLLSLYPYLPTPPLWLDMTQGQFFKRSLTGFNSEFSFS